MERRLYRLSEVLDLVPRSRTQLYRDMAAGLLEFVQVGARRYFEPAAIDRYIDALKAQSPTVQQLVELIDEDGRLDVTRIPSGTTLADLEQARQIVAQGKAVAA